MSEGSVEVSETGSEVSEWTERASQDGFVNVVNVETRDVTRFSVHGIKEGNKCLDFHDANEQQSALFCERCNYLMILLNTKHSY